MSVHVLWTLPSQVDEQIKHLFIYLLCVLYNIKHAYAAHQRRDIYALNKCTANSFVLKFLVSMNLKVVTY